MPEPLRVAGEVNVNETADAGSGSVAGDDSQDTATPTLAAFLTDQSITPKTVPPPWKAMSMSVASIWMPPNKSPAF